MRGKANGTPAEGSDTFLMFPPVELRQMSAFMAFSRWSGPHDQWKKLINHDYCYRSM
jgi:hypothetical protein